VAQVLETSGWIGAAGIQRQDGSFVNSPPHDAIVESEDAVVVITKSDEGGHSFHSPPTDKMILLADDHRALRLLFARKLASAGHEVIQAATGDDALVKAKSHRPDLIVLDVNMPHRDGYAVCAELRKDRQFDGVPVILYSGNETEAFMQRGRDAGATLCLRKTSNSSELLARIEEVFAAQRSAADDMDRTSVESVGGGCLEEDLKGAREAYDFSMALENVNGDRKLLSELVEVLLEDTPRSMARLSNAVSQSDYSAMRLESHSLKSAVAIFGAVDATNAAAHLEAIDDDVDRNTLDRLHENLKIRIEELIAGLAGMRSSG
jgi:DNA-binding response OmpR family regulator